MYAQYRKRALDRDAKEGLSATINRHKSRIVVDHALDTLQGRIAVVVTGQLGIGRTLGSMMYSIQCLIHRNEPRHSWQGGKNNMLQEKEEGDEKRTVLVCAIPRPVFASKLLRRALKVSRDNAKKAAESISDFERYEAMRGKFSPFITRHPVSVSATLFHLFLVPVTPTTWMERVAIRHGHPM